MPTAVWLIPTLLVTHLKQGIHRAHFQLPAWDHHWGFPGDLRAGAWFLVAKQKRRLMVMETWERPGYLKQTRTLIRPCPVSSPTMGDMQDPQLPANQSLQRDHSLAIFTLAQSKPG